MLIATTGDRFSDFGPYVASVNNLGEVAFQATLRAGGTGVYVGTGGEVRTVGEAPCPGITAFTSHPDLDDVGGISVYASGPPDALWTKRAGQGVRREFAFIGPAGPSMNHALVAFRATLADGRTGMFVDRPDGPRALALSGDRWSSFEGVPVVNAGGTVAFRGNLRGGGEGIHTWRDGVLRTVAESGPTYRSLGRFPGLDDAGTVSFVAADADGDIGAWLDRDGVLESIPTPFATLRTALVYGGGVVYAASPPGGALGAWRGFERLLCLGDDLFDAPVVDLAFNPVSVNEHGQVALRVALADGRGLVLRADPPAR